MITVLGAEGFIGSHIVEKLASDNIACSAPGRQENLQDKDLGDVIFCIGLTADFRKRAFDTVEAHVCKLLDILRTGRFDSLLYLSSTRLYGMSNTANEEDGFLVDPSVPGDLYNISKLMGESLLNASGRCVRIARLSNVFGEDLNSENFLSDIIKQAIQTDQVEFETSSDSEKDYISIKDVVDLLIKIATRGKQKIYNVASGINVSNRQIADKLTELTGCVVKVSPKAKTARFPIINVGRIRSEFGFHPSKLLVDEMEKLVSQYKQ